MLRSDLEGFKAAGVEESVEGSRVCEVDVVAHPDWQPHHQHNYNSFLDIIQLSSTFFNILQHSSTIFVIISHSLTLFDII